jgi:tripartite-type tricarboxylate transporter receptor subunit TctC
MTVCQAARGIGRRRALQWSLAGLAAPAAAAAQEGSLRIVVPFSAGSGTDNVARVFGEAVRLTTGRTVIVDDKPGGGMFTTGGHTTNAVLMRPTW